MKTLVLALAGYAVAQLVLDVREMRRWDVAIAAGGAAPPGLDFHVAALPWPATIDPDIRQIVDAMEPTSLAQRVALENTLQRRRTGEGWGW